MKKKMNPLAVHRCLIFSNGCSGERTVGDRNVARECGGDRNAVEADGGTCHNRLNRGKSKRIMKKHENIEEQVRRFS